MHQGSSHCGQRGLGPTGDLWDDPPRERVIHPSLPPLAESLWDAHSLTLWLVPLSPLSGQRPLADGGTWDTAYLEGTACR